MITGCLLYHRGWLRLVHFDHTTMILQGGDGPSAVRWCTITLQSCFITVAIYVFIISILLSLSMLLGWRLLCIFFSPFGLEGVLVRVSIINLTSFQCARINGCLVCLRKSQYEWWVVGLLQRVDPLFPPMYWLCSIRMHWIPYRPQYLVFRGNEIKPRFRHQIRHKLRVKSNNWRGKGGV